MTYAENTTVTVEKSKAELDALLRKHGAAQRVFGDDDVRGFAHAKGEDPAEWAEDLRVREWPGVRRG